MTEPPDLDALIGITREHDLMFRKNAAGIERLLLQNLLRAADMTGAMRAYDVERPFVDMPSYADVAWIGLSHALSLLAPEGMQGPGVAHRIATPADLTWATYYLYRCGLVVHLKRLAQLVTYGLAEAEVEGGTKVRFLILADDLEAVDREAIRWYARKLTAQNEPVREVMKLQLEKAVQQELEARVSSDPTFGIRYSSSRQLESYFELEAELRAASLPGHDSLSENARLGPLTFGQYRTAAVVGIARCLKHTAFVDTLHRRDERTPVGLLTIFSDDTKLRDEWGGLLGLNDFQADTLFDVLGVTADDLPELQHGFDCPQALLVRAGDAFWHMPVYGGLNNPFTWVNRKLRRRFRSDWDRAVDEREQIFRDDLRGLFPEPRFWFAPTPVKLRGASNVRTDVDAIVLDRVAGTLGVFQLKWQDAFENSLAERHSRSRNLGTTGSAWVEAVLSHCGGTEDVRSTAQRLHLPPREVEHVKAVRLFVLARNGAKFSGVAGQDRRAAWLSWFDLLRRCERARRDQDPLTRVWRSARRKGQAAQENRVQSFEVDGVQVEVIWRAGDK